MKRIIISGAVGIAVVLTPLLASAHEHQRFEIGGELYEFTIGSLNEPIAVDDKTGVDLRVVMVGHETMGANEHHAAGGAVTGLEESLKVELIAGNEKKVLSLTPVFNTPGSYKAPFYPTVATTLTYRVFGELKGTPVDFTFTCNPAGHPVAPEDKTRVLVSDGVVRIYKSGAFGCPAEKASMGFPEQSASVAALQNETETSTAISYGAGAIALLALALALLRRRS